MMVLKLHSYVMSNKTESFNLIQIFPLLQLVPVTFLLATFLSVIEQRFDLPSFKTYDRLESVLPKALSSGNAKSNDVNDTDAG